MFIGLFVQEIEDYSYGELRRSSSHNSIGNNSLFSSPSMPNISLSAHHIANNVSVPLLYSIVL